jgi:hypothetical protein
MPRRSAIDLLATSTITMLRLARVADLVAAGLSRETIAARVRSGRWLRPFPGVIATQSGALSREQQIEAARLYCGDGSVLTGSEAARRYGLRRLPEVSELHLLVPEDRHRRCLPGLVVERTARLPPTVERSGVVLAEFDRAVLDAARRLADRDGIRALLGEAVGERRTRADRLLAELDVGNQRGSALVRDVLDEIAEGIRSAAEGWGRDLHARSGLPPMLWNPTLRLPNGRFLARPDGYIIEVGLAWEQDSWEFHPPDEDDTARRRADMVGAGLVVAHHRPRRVRREPDRVLTELWAHYRLAASRPTPDIVVIPHAA